MPEEEEEQGRDVYYMVSKICAERTRGGRRQFLVRWEGRKKPTWELCRNVPSGMLDEFVRAGWEAHNRSLVPDLAQSVEARKGRRLVERRSAEALTDSHDPSPKSYTHVPPRAHQGTRPSVRARTTPSRSMDRRPHAAACTAGVAGVAAGVAALLVPRGARSSPLLLYYSFHY